MLTVSHRRDDEDGFTLIELMVSVAIMGAIIGALATAMFSLLTTRKQTITTLSASHGAQEASSFFGNDAFGAAAFTTGGSTGCSSPALPATSTVIVAFSGTDVAPTPSPRPSPTPASPVTVHTTTTAYVWDNPGAANSDLQILRRIACTDGGAGTSTTMTQGVVSTPYLTSSCSVPAAPPAAPPSGGASSLALVVPVTDGTTTLPVLLCAQRRPS